MTVVSEVSQSAASSLMVLAATPAGSAIAASATRRSEGGSVGSRALIRTSTVGGGPASPPAGAEVADRPAAGPVEATTRTPRDCRFAPLLMRGSQSQPPARPHPLW